MNTPHTIVAQDYEEADALSEASYWEALAPGLRHSQRREQSRSRRIARARNVVDNGPEDELLPGQSQRRAARLRLRPTFGLGSE